MGTNQSLEKVRFARESDVEVLWSFYRDRGFLYPEKIKKMQEKNTGFEMLKTLVGLNSNQYRVCLGFNNGEIVAACTLGLFSKNECWVMHLVGAGNRLSTLRIILNATKEVMALDVPFVSYFFRSTNKSVCKFFMRPINGNGSLLRSLSNAPLYNYFYFNKESLYNKFQASGEVRKGNNEDINYILKKLPKESSMRMGLYAVGEVDENNSILEVGNKLREVNLTKKRKVFVVDKGKEPVGIAIADISPPWWNLSNMSTGIRIWMCDFSRETWSLLFRKCQDWYKESNIQNFTLMVDDSDYGALELLQSNGFSPERKYQQISVPKIAMSKFSDYYSRYLRRY